MTGSYFTSPITAILSETNLQRCKLGRSKVLILRYATSKILHHQPGNRDTANNEEVGDNRFNDFIKTP